MPESDSVENGVSNQGVSLSGDIISDISGKVYKNIGNPSVLSRIRANCQSVLDIGCGAGDNARAIRQTMSHVKIIGVTGSEQEAELARDVCDDVLICNLEDGIPDLANREFDTVICSHVLEHICFPSKLLADICKVMNRDSRMIVALPNLMYYKSRAKLALGRFEYQQSGTMDYTHFRWYTFASAQKLFSDHGFEVIDSTVDSSVPLPLLRRIVPKSFVDMLDSIGGKVSPGLFGHQMLYVCKIKL